MQELHALRNKIYKDLVESFNWDFSKCVELGNAISITASGHQTQDVLET